MPYDPVLVQPMREELTAVGIEELETADAVDQFLADKSGSAMLVINSVCGCAAGSARPGIKMALRHEVTPDRVATVFAGQDLDATARARSHFAHIPPSSPSIALFRGGDLVFMYPRHQIEGRPPQMIAADLMEAFNEHLAGCPGLSRQTAAAVASAVMRSAPPLPDGNTMAGGVRAWSGGCHVG